MSKFRKIRADKVRPGDRLKTRPGYEVLVTRVQQSGAYGVAVIYGSSPRYKSVELCYRPGNIVSVR